MYISFLSRNRLEKGGEQLASSSGYIEKLKKDIETLQPQLDEKKKVSSRYVVFIEPPTVT